MNRIGWLDSLAQDIRYAIRGMRQAPGLTVTAVATLAIGIGVNAAVFTVTNAVLFKGFAFVHDNHRVVYLRTRNAGRPEQRYGFSSPDAGVSYADFADWRAQSTAFTGMAAYSYGRPVDLSGTNRPADGDQLAEISVNTFALLGLKPALGRDFAPSDEALGAAPVAILSYGVWQARYGRDQAIVGQTIRINGVPTTVIGVMAQGSSFLPGFAVWMPLAASADRWNRDARRLWFVVGRLADGVTIASARAEMDTIGQRLASTYPADSHFTPIVQTFNDQWTGPRLALLYQSMWGAVGCVLLIACANLANLLMARAIGRSREIAVRIALGAGRWRIIRQLLMESCLLSATGGLLGWWIAVWCVRGYVLAAYPGQYTSWDFAMDGRVIGYLAAISIGTGALFGLAPAFRLSKLDVHATLKDGGRSTTGGQRGKSLSTALVIGQIALAVVLLTGAGLMIRGFLRLYAADLGVSTANILIAGYQLPAAGFPSPEARASFRDHLKTRLTAIPGIASVALANTLPAGGSLTLPYELAGAPTADAQHRPSLAAMIIDEDYFRTLGTTVVAGRAFDDADGPSGAPVVIVNQRFANQVWPGDNPLGKRLRLLDGAAPEAWRTVIGVAPNIVQRFLSPSVSDGWRGDFDPLIYLPYRQRPPVGLTMFARTQLPAESLSAAVRGEIQTLNPDQPSSVTMLTETVASQYRATGVNAALFLLFAGIALLLAALGLYAVVAHAVSRRTQEIGIRMAMGASARDVLTLVFRQGALSVGIGLAVGLTASAAVAPVLRSALVQIPTYDPVTFALAPVVLSMTATLGCLIPALRAMRIGPVGALRHD